MISETPPPVKKNNGYERFRSRRSLTARFAGYHFNETVFPSLEGDKKKMYTDVAKVTKSHIPAANIPARKMERPPGSINAHLERK
ncbi:hypothetical protein C5167_021357 [Papaver somniferum]|uniref:Uncharacterized protein n=1 Tax=Papaver somniferum TaxID=3469 RepID=A0A4Y7IVL3_PAPSO|nr:hypothetical protein C5167_021357 [Papaver somniferum]